MPNNFRIVGDYYVSKEGSDSNNGTSPETPKLTIQAGLNLLTTANKILVVGSGVYSETLSKTYSVTSNIIADGDVTLDGNNRQFNIANVVSGNVIVTTWDGFRFINYNSISNATSGNNTQVWVYRNSTFINCNQFLISTTNGGGYVINCKFINIPDTSIWSALSGNNSFSYCIFINSTCRLYGTSSAAPMTFLNNYLDSTSYVSLSNITTVTFNFNNIQGKIAMFINGAVSGANSNGVAQSFAQHRIDYPTYNINSISADPKFNDAQNLNLTLQSDSPHIKGANDYISNIGGTEYAVYLKASDAELTTGATVSNLTLQANNSYVITSPNTTGSIVSDGKFIQWPRTKPLTRIEWVGSLDFNKSITAGTAGNQNVPDYETATSGAAASPDRLCLKMRYSTQQTKPTTSGQWDNGGYWTAGEYRLFEINQKPKIDANGIGNGSSSYVEFSGLGDIVPSWIQVDIILINNYNP